ncbi:uncharacterized protein LOC121347442 [Onychostruthus taczanowskii]|uniref:uncharacterized protein LOC121347442 n=1 Tax=Onychostruthus taczanowskii TaxID=356909 RepID=UPI001B80290A|nr:uncharacterized protein LOC121347442 [Onychostruthus taczanowskii]
MAARGAPEAPSLPLPVSLRGPGHSHSHGARSVTPPPPPPPCPRQRRPGPSPGRQGAPLAEAARAEAAPSPGNGVGVGAMSGGAGRRRRLVLHVDLNNTVVVADTVTGQAPRAALNTFLSTVTWGRVGAAGQWEWVSDRPSLRPPCPGALSYYSRHGRDPAFTEAGPGRRFRDLHARHLRLLEWPGRPHDALSVPGEPGKRYHLILPSFFRLLDALHRDGRAFAVVFRTFGSDLPRALQAVGSALRGQHPQFPACCGTWRSLWTLPLARYAAARKRWC